MNFFDALTSGFGSLLGALFTSLLIVGGVLYLCMSRSRRGSLEPMALICGAILFCFLFYQFTLMYTAIHYKGVYTDFIAACNLQFGGEIDGPALRDNMLTAIRENPLLGFFIDYGDLEDFDWSQPVKSLRDVVAREFNWYIFRRIVWASVFTLIFGGASLVLSGGGRSKSRNRHGRSYDDDSFSTTEDSGNYDF